MFFVVEIILDLTLQYTLMRTLRSDTTFGNWKLLRSYKKHFLSFYGALYEANSPIFFER